MIQIWYLDLEKIACAHICINRMNIIFWFGKYKRICVNPKRISEWKRIIQNRMANSNLGVFHVCGNDYHHHYYSWFGAGLKRSKFCESWDLSGAKFSQAKNFSNKKPFNVDLFHILPTMRISQSTTYKQIGLRALEHRLKQVAIRICCGEVFAFNYLPWILWSIWAIFY